MTVENVRQAPRRAIIGWVLFDPAAQPFFTLIITFVYAPYFASAVAANPVEGQALWGYATAAAALVVAMFSPILGAIADASGRRKPWIAGFGVLVVIGASLLWFGRPGDASVIPLVLAAYVIGVIGIEFAGVFNNAMMPTLVSPERVGRLSGTGWAAGYVGGLLSLILVLGFLAGNPHTGKTLLGITPLFGLDPALREGDRAVGPLTAIWFVVFILPLFLFTPDARGMPLRAAVREGIATLGQTLRALPRNRSVMTFLIANMIYTDGMLALFAFGGIYAAGTFGWGTIQIGTFGILLNITAMIGAYFGGKLDDRLGSKRVILGSLAILIVAVIGFLSIGRDHVLFVIPSDPPVPGAPMFAATGEKLYVAIGLVIGLVVGPAQAASRTLVVRLAPAGRITQFFGLLALSGKVTSFMGPLLVAVVTAAFASQKAGMAVLVGFFAVGALILSRVNAGSAASR
jgi:UMF1 family MFS transporter